MDGRALGSFDPREASCLVGDDESKGQKHDQPNEKGSGRWPMRGATTQERENFQGLKAVRGGEGTARLAAQGGGAENEEYRAAPLSEKENFGKRGASVTSTARSSP